MVDDSVTLDPEICKMPHGNYSLNANCLQALLENSAVCKNCSSPLKIMEKIGSRHGWGSKWLFCCSNSACSSHDIHPFLSGQVYEVNCASVLAFCAIDKGRAAAQKFTSVMNLQSLVCSWPKHTTFRRKSERIDASKLQGSCMGA